MIKVTLHKDAPKAECLILPVFEGDGLDEFGKEMDARMHGMLNAVVGSKDFDGQAQQYNMVHTGDKELPRMLLIGLGKQKDVSLLAWKRTVGTGIVIASNKKIKNVALYIPADIVKKIGDTTCAYETAVAMELANYSFDEYKVEKSRAVLLTDAAWVMPDLQTKEVWQKSASEGAMVADMTNEVRRLGNTPPSIMTPTFLAKQAQALAKGIPKTKVTVLSKSEIKKLGMGCFLGVAQGSMEDPKFIIVEYKGGVKTQKPTVLVGKGITFDSGGLSIKPDQYMCEMKFDMLGAATALGSLIAAAKLGIKKNIVALLPACENMPSGSAYRPDDILTAMNGQTVLVENTDAEGRLILSDALCYAHIYNPKEVIDFATLTGACMVAIGTERSGLFSPDDAIARKLTEASEAVAEQLWRLPLGEEYTDAVKCDVADINNMGGVGGNRRYGGASAAAAFLQFFTTHPKTKKTYPWAHIDMSSCYNGPKGKPYIRGGANGFGVQTMVEYLRT